MTIYDLLKKAALNWPHKTFLSDNDTHLSFYAAFELVKTITRVN